MKDRQQVTKNAIRMINSYTNELKGLLCDARRNTKVYSFSVDEWEKAKEKITKDDKQDWNMVYLYSNHKDEVIYIGITKWGAGKRPWEFDKHEVPKKEIKTITFIFSNLYYCTNENIESYLIKKFEKINKSKPKYNKKG